MNAFLFSVAFVTSNVNDYAHLVREEREAAARLAALGAIVWREHELANIQEERKGWPPLPPRGAPLLRRIMGDDVFDPIKCVQFNASVSDKDLKVLQKCRKLNTLFLGQTKVTDLGIKNVAKCESLQILDLDATAITDRALELLAGLRLNYLSIAETNVSEKAVAEFQRANPPCEVIHRIR
jgi:hypothetical protein